MIRRTLRVLLGLVGAVVLAGGATVVALRVTNPRPHERPGWAQLADLPDARGEVASAVADGKLYVAGGLRGVGSTDDRVSVYDLERDRWSDGGTIAPRHHAAAAAIGTTVYVSGGAGSATDWTPQADVFAIGGREPAPMPEGRQGHAMVAIGRRLYVVGGVGATSDTLIYSASSDKWRRGAALPASLDHLRAVVWRGRIWALGGRDGSDPANAVWVYDPGRDGWRDGPALPEPMSAMAVGVIDDELHIIGGEDPAPLGGGVSDDHFVLAHRSDRWLRLGPPLLPVHGAGFGTFQDRLFVVGGASRQGALSTISWTAVTQVFDRDG